MIIATHSPDMCPMVNPQIKEKSLPMLQKLEDIARAAGATVVGSWTDIPAHTIYVIVDASNAHVVSKAMIDTHLMEWNIVKVSPLTDMKEVVSMLSK
jgi:hypothetical protein